MKLPPVVLKNPRTGEIWHCEDFRNRRIVEGAEFIEVNKPNLNRKVWIALDALVKVNKGNKLTGS